MAMVFLRALCKSLERIFYFTLLRANCSRVYVLRQDTKNTTVASLLWNSLWMPSIIDSVCYNEAMSIIMSARHRVRSGQNNIVKIVQRHFFSG